MSVRPETRTSHERGDTADLAAPLLTEAGIQDPFPIYARLREAAPVYWSDALGGWLVTTYREVREVYRSHDRFINAKKYTKYFEMLPADLRAQLPTLSMLEATPALALADRPIHTRQRALLMPALTPRRLAQKRAWIEEICAQLAEDLAKQSEPDLIKHFSTPLSYRSLIGLFGAQEEISVYEEAALAFTEYINLSTARIPAAIRLERAMAALREVIESVYPALREHDDGTIISALLHLDHPAKRLENDEMFALLKVFFSGGQENIAYSIPTTVHELLRHPDQMEQLRAEPSLAAAAYEETLRFDSPLQHNPRVSATETELGGQHIHEGDRILNFKGSATHDPSVWTRPDDFDIDRDRDEPEGGSISFGQGIHFCAGAGIARLEGPLALATLVRRFPNMRLPEGWRPRWLNIPANRKLSELPLVLDAPGH